MKFTKLSNNRIKLNSNGSIKDGLSLAKWARELMERCDAMPTNKNQAFTLSASHMTNYAPDEIILEFKAYYFADISTWLKITK